jgi:hypothetical protein
MAFFKKNEDYLKLLIKVLRNGCFHNGPVIYPRLSHNGPRKVVLALGRLHWPSALYLPSNIRIGPQISVLALKHPYLPPNLTSGICAVVSKKICQSTRKDGA